MAARARDTYCAPDPLRVRCTVAYRGGVASRVDARRGIRGRRHAGAIDCGEAVAAVRSPAATAATIGGATAVCSRGRCTRACRSGRHLACGAAGRWTGVGRRRRGRRTNAPSVAIGRRVRIAATTGGLAANARGPGEHARLGALRHQSGWAAVARLAARRGRGLARQEARAVAPAGASAGLRSCGARRSAALRVAKLMSPRQRQAPRSLVGDHAGRGFARCRLPDGRSRRLADHKTHNSEGADEECAQCAHDRGPPGAHCMHDSNLMGSC